MRLPLRAPAPPRAAGYSIDGFARCKAGGRPETSWGLHRNVKAHGTISTTSLGLFVLTPSCASSEGFEVTYLLTGWGYAYSSKQIPRAGSSFSLIAGSRRVGSRLD
jgi:hypothetical protein